MQRVVTGSDSYARDPAHHRQVFQTAPWRLRSRLSPPGPGPPRSVLEPMGDARAAGSACVRGAALARRKRASITEDARNRAPRSVGDPRSGAGAVGARPCARARSMRRSPGKRGASAPADAREGRRGARRDRALPRRLPDLGVPGRIGSRCAPSAGSAPRWEADAREPRVAEERAGDAYAYYLPGGRGRARRPAPTETALEALRKRAARLPAEQRPGEERLHPARPSTRCGAGSSACGGAGAGPRPGRSSASSNAVPHAAAARLLLDVLLETGRAQEAGRVAEDFSWRGTGSGTRTTTGLRSIPFRSCSTPGCAPAACRGPTRSPLRTLWLAKRRGSTPAKSVAVHVGPTLTPWQPHPATKRAAALTRQDLPFPAGGEGLACWPAARLLRPRPRPRRSRGRRHRAAKGRRAAAPRSWIRSSTPAPTTGSASPAKPAATPPAPAPPTPSCSPGGAPRSRHPSPRPESRVRAAAPGLPGRRLRAGVAARQEVRPLTSRAAARHARPAPTSPAALPCASPSQCASGFCADGVCCDSACTGRCMAAHGGEEALRRRPRELRLHLGGRGSRPPLRPGEEVRTGWAECADHEPGAGPGAHRSRLTRPCGSAHLIAWHATTWK